MEKEDAGFFDYTIPTSELDVLFAVLKGLVNDEQAHFVDFGSGTGAIIKYANKWWCEVRL